MMYAPTLFARGSVPMGATIFIDDAKAFLSAMCYNDDKTVQHCFWFPNQKESGHLGTARLRALQSGKENETVLVSRGLDWRM